VGCEKKRARAVSRDEGEFFRSAVKAAVPGGEREQADVETGNRKSGLFRDYVGW